MVKIKTNVYVDAFNLYYNCLKGTPYKWLDIAAYCAAELPSNEINHIRIFTARVKSRPNDPQQPDRQNAYFRALATLPNLSIHFGSYLESTARMPLVAPIPGLPRVVEVKKSEEKGSDVNLATYLLLDAFKKECEAAVVITNDSDLMEPIRIARKEFGLKVVILHPCKSGRTPSIQLQKVSSLSRPVNTALLPNCQFADTLSDATGIITKPPTW